MAGIILPSGGVNRKVKKVPFADLSGVQRNAKTGWLGVPSDGVTRKVFSAGMSAKFEYFGIWFSTSDNHYPTISNNSTPEILNVTTGFGAGTLYSITNLVVKLPVSGIVTDGTPLIRVTGQITVSNAPKSGSTNKLSSISGSFYNTNYWTYPLYAGTGLLGTWHGNPIYDGTYNIDVVIPFIKHTANNYDLSTDSFQLLIVVDKGDGGNVVTPMQISIPWASFVWLPTGEKLVYQP